MARNEEKAQSMLARFLAAKKEENAKPKEKRPYLASECRDLADADKWRQQILREIGRKVMEIQNPGLGEHRLRDLNDEINKLIREKGHWEKRILELGGPNYAKLAPKVTDAEGKEVVGAAAASGKGPGYRYFGAAKTLPGVKELFEKGPEKTKKRSRYELYKRIDADYYGFRDDEDGLLEHLEQVAEKKARERAIAEWQRLEKLKEDARSGVQEVVRVGATEDLEEDADVRVPLSATAGADDEEEELEEERRRRDSMDAKGNAATHREFVAHVPLPDEKEIERMVLEKKKAELLSKYASEELLKEEEEAKSLLNIKR